MSEAELVHNADHLEATYDFFDLDEQLNPARADWAMLGNFYDKTVLVVGECPSALSLTLASRAQHVTHAACRQDSTGFVTELVRMRKLTNVTAIEIELEQLANEQASYDRIILADALAQIGHRPAAGSPREQQREMLATLRTRLTSDGELWIAAENRLAPKHVIGLLPTWAKQFGERATGSGHFSRHLATETALRSMLHHAGYHDLDVFYAVTDYERPRFISSTTDDSVIGTHLANVREGARLKAKIALGILTAVDRFGHAGRFSPYLIVRAAP